MDGWHSDSARTVIVGTADPEDQRLSDVTEEAMWHGIAALATGKFVGDIGNAVDDYVSSVPGKPLGILEDYVGHGIGSEMHMAPDVLNYRTSHRGPRSARACAWPSSRCWSAAASKPRCWRTTGRS